MASPVAWITSALDSTFWAKACKGSGHQGSLTASPHPPASPTHLHRVHAILLGGGHVEPDLHERNLGVVVLVELQRHLVLARGALGHIAERDLEHRLLPDVKGQQLPCGDITASSELCPTNPTSSHSLAPLPKSSSASALITAFPPLQNLQAFSLLAASQKHTKRNCLIPCVLVPELEAHPRAPWLPGECQLCHMCRLHTKHRPLGFRALLRWQMSSMSLRTSLGSSCSQGNGWSSRAATLMGKSCPTASGTHWNSPPNLTVPQFQPFTQRSFSASSRQ